jgi:hypothetical protein
MMWPFDPYRMGSCFLFFQRRNIVVLRSDSELFRQILTEGQQRPQLVLVEPLQIIDPIGPGKLLTDAFGRAVERQDAVSSIDLDVRLCLVRPPLSSGGIKKRPLLSRRTHGDASIRTLRSIRPDLMRDSPWAESAARSGFLTSWAKPRIGRVRLSGTGHAPSSR